MWYVYQIINEKGNFKYIGITQNLKVRLHKHNSGSTKSTKPYRPFNKIIIIKSARNRIEARKLEKYYKSGIGREIIKIRGLAQLA